MQSCLFNDCRISQLNLAVDVLIDIPFESRLAQGYANDSETTCIDSKQ